jgi:isopentenyl diphosphate isomerase/L-lactate dehydrogenase-like FMN-dependent dehydrogenase
LPLESYIEGGAGEERTLAANRFHIGAIGLNPRLGVSSGRAPDLSTMVLGRQVSMPLLMGPVGFTRMMHTAGDVAGAAAAGQFGTIFTLSTMSGHSMAEVMGASSGPKWFQLYFLGGREGARRLVSDARESGFDAIVVTMDTQVPGDRQRERRYGLSPPLTLDRRTARKMVPFVMSRPAWLLDQARSRFNLDLALSHAVVRDGVKMTSEESLVRWIAEPPLWEDLDWIKEEFNGPVIVKGVLSAADARRAIEHGAAAVVVSNHGGRQLDGAPATFEVLPEVVAEIRGEAEVLVDGGIRSGADVVRALALGAQGAMVGRAWAYGLCAAGQPGVERVLALLREDIDRTMRLVGVECILEIDGSVIR